MNPAFHFAIVMGIPHYPGISDLQSAGRDAASFYDWLVQDAGVPAANIEKVIAAQPAPALWDARPTRTEFNNALRSLHQRLQQAIAPDPLRWKESRLYIYVSGHGIAPDGSEAALLMANAGSDAWGENIPCHAYLRRYEKCQYFAEVVIFADCCRLRESAEFLGPPFNCDGGTNIGRVNTFFGFATQQGDAAYEPVGGADPNEARSYFTQALLEGLRGAAIDPVTGEINTTSLANYVNARVPAMTAGKDYPQVPKMPVDLAAPIVFRPAPAPKPGAAPARPLRQVQIVLPAAFAGRAVLRDAQFATLATHAAAAGPWHATLPDGYYEVLPDGAADGTGFRHQGLFRVLGQDCHVDL